MSAAWGNPSADPGRIWSVAVLSPTRRVAGRTRARGAMSKPGPTGTGSGQAAEGLQYPGRDLILSRRVDRGPRAPGTGDRPLRPPATSLSGLCAGSDGRVPFVRSLDLVASGLSRPSLEEESRSARPSSRALSSLQLGCSFVLCG